MMKEWESTGKERTFLTVFQSTTEVLRTSAPSVEMYNHQCHGKHFVLVALRDFVAITQAECSVNHPRRGSLSSNAEEI